jgi:hypothetical protein
MKSRNLASLLWSVIALFLSTAVPTSLFAADAVPPPWQGVDVGDVGLAGSSSYASDGTLIVNGAGSDIWGTADSFHFVYQSFHDTTIDGDLPQQDGTNPFAKAGLMIGQNLDPGSPHVVLDVKPDGGIEFMTRQTQGGPTTFIAGARGTGGGRLLLIRSNGTVTARRCDYGMFTACTTIGSTPFPSGLALAGVVVTSHDPSTLNQATFGVGSGLGLPFVFPVSPPLFSLDVGAVGVTGSAFVDDGTFTIKGAGADIWGTSDSFHIVGTEIQNDGEVVARVTSEDAANTFAKAGVFMRTGTSTGGTGPETDTPTVILDIRPNGIIEFMARPSKGAPMQFVAGSAASFPVWLKLERRGSQFTGLMSQDGTEWSTVGITSVLMSGGPTAGLAVTSHDTAVLNTSTFDHFLVSGSFEPVEEDIGDVGIAGDYWVTPDGLYTVLYGGGADIWGTADAFHWLRWALIDDGQLSVQVSRPADTAGGAINSFAKAGVMIRESLDPSSANVILDVRPDGSIEFMARNASGVATTFIAGASSASEFVWLKLARSGSTITGFMSADGSTWTEVGSASPSIESMALIGIVVTSHRRGALATASFSQISR